MHNLLRSSWTWYNRPRSSENCIPCILSRSLLCGRDSNNSCTRLQRESPAYAARSHVRKSGDISTKVALNANFASVMVNSSSEEMFEGVVVSLNSRLKTSRTKWIFSGRYLTSMSNWDRYWEARISRRLRRSELEVDKLVWLAINVAAEWSVKTFLSRLKKMPSLLNNPNKPCNFQLCGPVMRLRY